MTKINNFYTQVKLRPFQRKPGQTFEKIKPCPTADGIAFPVQDMI